MKACVAEFFGTALLVLLGNGVVANVVLEKTKGHGAGWIVITAGWAFAVFSAVVCTAELSGAHLNPAVTVGLALNEQFEWGLAAGYIAAQLLGAFVGAILVYLYYMNHYDATDDADLKLATFCTSPAIRNLPLNFFCETLGTMVLVLAVLSFAPPTFPFPHAEGLVPVKVGLGTVGAFQVALIVFSIGLSLGGTTGYAINPVRDLGPRIAHALLPIRNKRNSDWGYAFVPAVGPIAGAALAVAAYKAMNP
jgi:glycerol uptake facilitator protein